MSTPTAPTKRVYCAALKRGTVWGTAVAVGATDGILIPADSGLALNQRYEQYPAIDQIMPMDGSLGINEAPEFTPPLDLQYEMGAWGRLLAAFFGTAGVPTIQGAGPAYKHVFQLADEPTHFFAYCEERPGKIWEVASAMPFKLGLKSGGTSPARISAAITLRGNTMIDDSAVNTATQLDAVTYADRGNFATFSQCKFLMNEQSGVELADPTHKVDIADFDLAGERGIDKQHIAGSVNIIQPREGVAPSFGLKLTLPHASDTNLAYFSTFKALTAQKAKLYFTGALINATYYYTVAFYFPRLRFVGPPDVKLEDLMKTGIEFVAEAAASAPTGMSYARPYMEVINLQTTDYLA